MALPFYCRGLWALALFSLQTNISTQDDISLSPHLTHSDDSNEAVFIDIFDEFKTIPLHITRLRSTVVILRSIGEQLHQMVNAFQNELQDLRNREERSRLIIPAYQVASNSCQGAENQHAKQKPFAKMSAARKRSALAPVLDKPNRISKPLPRVNPVRGSAEYIRKVEFERQDFGLRNKITGLESLSTIVEDCQAVLRLRIHKGKNLARVGEKVGKGEDLNRKDVEKAALVHEEIQEGAEECEEIEKTIEILRVWLYTGKVETETHEENNIHE